jgi:hypothetical protein
MCTCVGLRIRGWRGANSLWEMGHLNNSMGIECREVCTLAPNAAIPRKVFLHLIVKYCIYCSSLQAKNKPQKGVTKCVLIPGPVSVVANSKDSQD